MQATAPRLREQASPDGTPQECRALFGEVDLETHLCGSMPEIACMFLVLGNWSYVAPDAVHGPKNGSDETRSDFSRVWGQAL